MSGIKFQEPTEANGKFVAFTAPERMEGPDGEAITAGSQTIINYYKGIKVDAIQDGGYAATKGGKVQATDVKTVRVEFEPESIGLQHAIAANIAPNDPGLAVLREAKENGGTVNVAIESFRKGKNKRTNEQISPLTPIYALLGAETPGGSANMTIAGENTTRVIAAVNGVTTSDCHSDATQWAQLGKNHSGNLPPEGFKFLSDPEDWKKVGVIIPVEGSKPAQGAVDGSTLAEVVGEVLDKKFGDFNDAEVRRYAPSLKDGQIGELQPWTARTLRDHVNMGMYAAGHLRWTYEWAWEHMGEVASPDAAWDLTVRTVNIAARLQGAVYGGFQPDMNLSSFKEILEWVRFVTTSQFPDTTAEDWEKSVMNGVKNVLVKVRGELDERFPSQKGARPQPARQQSAPAPQSAPAQAPVQSAPTPPQNAQQAPQQPAQAPAQSASQDKLSACLNAVEANWNDQGKLSAIYRHANQLGLLGTAVRDKGNGRFVPDSSSQLHLVDAISARGLALKNGAQNAPQQSAPAPAQQSAPAPEPQQEEAPAPAPAAESAPAPESQEDFNPEDFAASLGAEMSDAPQNSWGEKLAEVTDPASAQKLWSSASSSLKDEVEYEGEKMPLGDAFQKLNDKFTAAQEIVDEAQASRTVADITALRARAKSEGLLAMSTALTVTDDSGDDDQTITISVIDALKKRREEIHGK